MCDYPRPHGRQRKGKKNTTALLSRHPFTFPPAGFLLHYCPTYLCVPLAIHPSNCCSFTGFHLALSLPNVESPTPRIGRRTLRQLPFHTHLTPALPLLVCFFLLVCFAIIFPTELLPYNTSFLHLPPTAPLPLINSSGKGREKNPHHTGSTGETETARHNAAVH